ncbi:c-type cytochrome [Spirosoma foliorum]|uniref:Cytochrome c n=1 Tax=Spirosoma foliorum TaxID=2710596 RepID=A0A7G5H611_9BACT|nr:cytochrome c [Spirosoma foliorum]QMW06553.1 cytochrome c [Spirosoma foliorum]
MIRLTSLFGFFGILIGLVSCQSEEEIKRQRYITEGILVYKNNCANCHQSKGEGLASLYPPIAKSDFLGDKNKVICLMRYGQQGPIVVNGKPYNRPMPPQPQLSDLEIAELATYIYNEWGNETKLTDVKSIKPILEACK